MSDLNKQELRRMCGQIIECGGLAQLMRGGLFSDWIGLVTPKAILALLDDYDALAAELKTERLRADAAVGDANEAEQECERLREDCAQAYQVVGCLAGERFDDPQVTKALDNLFAAASGEARVHEDLLPFTVEPGSAAGVPSGYLSFDEWFAAKSAGDSFEQTHMGCGARHDDFLRALAFEVRQYASEMIRDALAAHRAGKEGE